MSFCVGEGGKVSLLNCNGGALDLKHLYYNYINWMVNHNFVSQYIKT